MMKEKEQKVMEEMECWQTSEHIKKCDKCRNDFIRREDLLHWCVENSGSQDRAEKVVYLGDLLNRFNK